MSAVGRNQPCRCGSGTKAKRCCGTRRGPSDAELARAFLAGQARLAARRLLRRSTGELDELFDQMLDLPARHLSLQLPLPRLFPPELEALRLAVDDDDPEAADEHIDAALVLLDTPIQRAELAHAVVDLAGADLIDGAVADTAVVDLDSASSALMRASLIHAVAVSVGASRTPSGLLVVAQ